MEDEDGILSHEKEMWQIILGKLLLLRVEFGKILLKEALLNTACSLKRTKLIQT